MLRVDGYNDLPLKSVRAFSRENEYEYIQEGGMNDYVHMRRKPISKPYTLVVERYVSTDLNDPLPNGVELMLPLLLFVGKNNGGGMSYGRYYVFTGGVVMCKEYGGLDAEKSGILTETVTIGYNQMFCVTNPIDDTGKSPWTMKEGNTTKAWSGKGDIEPPQNSQKWYTQDAKTGQHKINEDVRKLWEFDELKKAGEGTSSRSIPFKEETRADFERASVYYNFGKENNDKYKGSGTRNKPSQKSAKRNDKLIELESRTMAAKARKFALTDDGSIAGNGIVSSKKNENIVELRKDEMYKNSVKWEFDEKTKGGKGTQSSQSDLVQTHTQLPDGSSTGLGRPEDPVDTMAGRAQKWEFGATANEVGGAGARSAKELENQSTGAEFLENRKKWEFNDTKEGGGDRSRQNAVAGNDGASTGLGLTEPSREEMEGVASKWEFGTDKYVVEGNGVKSQQPSSIPQSTKEEMAGKANHWEFANKRKDGAGESSRQNAKKTGRGESSGMGRTELGRGQMEAGATKWQFDEGKTKKGQGASSRKPSSPKEASRKAMKDKSQKWEMTENGFEGGGKSSRATPKVPPLSKADMEKRAVHHKAQKISDFLMS